MSKIASLKFWIALRDRQGDAHSGEWLEQHIIAELGVPSSWSREAGKVTATYERPSEDRVARALELVVRLTPSQLDGVGADIEPNPDDLSKQPTRPPPTRARRGSLLRRVAIGFAVFAFIAHALHGHVPHDVGEHKPTTPEEPPPTDDPIVELFEFDEAFRGRKARVRISVRAERRDLPLSWR